MRASFPPDLIEQHDYDHDALRLMLSYVEAECLRIGATDAARHAALAAALMPGRCDASLGASPRAAPGASPAGATVARTAAPTGHGEAAARVAQAESARPRRAPRGIRLH